MKQNSAVFFALLMLAPMFQHFGAGQTGTMFNQRDDQYRLLGLKRAKEAYEFSRSEYERKRELFKGRLVSEQELEQARNAFSDAEVNYQQSLLAVLFEKQYVSVVGAVKGQSADGRKHVRLTVANTSGGSAEFRKLVEVDDELFRTLQPGIINDVYVSLLNDQNVIISQPYEAKIERLIYGKPVELDFVLLQDLDAVTVDIIYGNGSQRSPKIFLQKDAAVNKVLVQSEQFSQEVELGEEASFGLTLELFSGVADTFKMETVNLPEQITRYFVDTANQARLSQVKFTERTNTKRAALKVFLPDRPTEQVTMDKPIRFYVLVFPGDRMDETENLRQKSFSQEEIDALDVGYARLELIPRGVGKLLVRAQQLYHSIRPDESVEMTIDVANDGSRRLDNVEVEVDAPLNWDETIEPGVIARLAIGEERTVRLTFTPRPDVSVGRYEFRINTSSLSDNQPINGEEKSITIEVKAKANLLGTLIVVLSIIGVILGIVIFGIRLSRR